MEFEFIKEAVKPEMRVRGKYVGILQDWLETDNKTLKLVCKDANEKKNLCTCVTVYRKNHNLDYTIYRERGTYNVYLVRS